MPVIPGTYRRSHTSPAKLIYEDPDKGLRGGLMHTSAHSKVSRGHTGINRERASIGPGAHQVIDRLAAMAPVIDHDPEALVQPFCNAPPALCFSTLPIQTCTGAYDTCPLCHKIASVRPDSTNEQGLLGREPLPGKFASNRARARQLLHLHLRMTHRHDNRRMQAEDCMAFLPDCPSCLSISSMLP